MVDVTSGDSGGSTAADTMRAMASDARVWRPSARYGAAGLAAIALVLTAGCGSDDAAGTGVDDTVTTTIDEQVADPDTTEIAASDAVEVIDPWARLPAMGQSVAAAYLSVSNLSDQSLLLAGVESDFARVELHETIAADDGVMSMRERTEGFEIDAGATLVMEPGGVHVMLFDVDRDEMLMVGEIPVVLDFGDAGPVSVMAEVRDVAGMDHGGMHHGDMDHGGMDHGEAAPGAPDVNAMHALDDELHAGVLDPERQRATVAQFRAAVIAAETLTDEQLAVMLDALDRLDAELAAGDLSAAAAVAFEVHDLAHDYIDHHHGHHHDHHHDHSHDHDHDHSHDHDHDDGGSHSHGD